MRIGVYGLGYVGAVTAGCLADLGHHVIGVDINPDKVSSILEGRAPLIEPGLDDLLEDQVRRGRLTASVDGLAVAADVDMALLAIGTPSTPSGGLDSQHLLTATREVGLGFRSNPREFCAVVNRSTSLPQVHEAVMAEVEAASGRSIGTSLGYVCHPEFLRETTAIDDFVNPPLIVYGVDGPATADLCRSLYPGIEAPTFEVSVGEAAMVKYASNCWHAVKVTFANEIGELCRRSGLDANHVMDLFCVDDKLNISARYLRPGNPFGGSCLPKDLRAVLDFARQEAIVLPMLQGALLSNSNQIQALGDRVLASHPTRVAVVGLSFKEGTDDLREAPLVPVVERLIGKGVQVAIYDGGLAVDELIGSNRAFALSSVPHLADLVSDRLDEVIAGADVVVVGHHLDGSSWDGLTIDTSTAILDLVGVQTLGRHPGYEGLFWEPSAHPATAQT